MNKKKYQKPVLKTEKINLIAHAGCVKVTKETCGTRVILQNS